MPWYDTFSRFYDTALERHYAAIRELAAEALDLKEDSVVLDCPTGTGASLPALARRVGARGGLVGVDLSEGMAAQARARIAAAGWTNARVVVGDATSVPRDAVAFDGRPPDRLHVFLGLSVIPEPAVAFDHLFGLLPRGGRCVIVDVYADPPGLWGRAVQQIARADLRRRSWDLLAARCERFERRDLPYRWDDGGQIWLATGVKP